MLSRRGLAFCLAGAAVVGVAAVEAAELTFVLRIEKGRVPANVRLIRVKQGDTVKLQWSADRRTAIHLHGYDIEKTIEPGVATELTFTARATGRFTIAPHVGKQASGGHAHGDVLVTIEVYP
jgi:FtsP/CotA-like multicopper oxidase with cupredoxin domain